MWQTFGLWLAGGGAASIAGMVVWLLNRWHKDAIQSMRESRDAYREIASYERQRADLREEQLFGTVLSRASEKV